MFAKAYVFKQKKERKWKKRVRELRHLKIGNHTCLNFHFNVDHCAVYADCGMCGIYGTYAVTRWVVLKRSRRGSVPMLLALLS